MLAHLRHLFTPHHTNNHRPRILHPAGLSILIALFLFTNASLKLFAAFDNQLLLSGSVLGYASDITVEQVVDLTNQERAKLGKSQLTYNDTLSLAAQAKATDMFTFDYWAHNNPETDRQPWYYIRDAGYNYRYAGENLARDFGDTPTLIAAWMASTSHRDNIVSNRYSEIGIAVVNGNLQGVDTTLVVQMFGTKATAQALSSTSTLGDGSAAKPTIGIAAASEPSANSSSISPFSISKAVSMSILLLLAVTLLVDYLIIKRRKTIRVTGKNLAHLGFIGILIIIVLLSAPGGIL